MINGVIAQKLQNLDSVLIELHSLGCLTIQELEQDWRTKRAVERSLQILVEISIVRLAFCVWAITRFLSGMG
jgi:hypothetical protein